MHGFSRIVATLLWLQPDANEARVLKTFNDGRRRKIRQPAKSQLSGAAFRQRPHGRLFVNFISAFGVPLIPLMLRMVSRAGSYDAQISLVARAALIWPGLGPVEFRGLS